MRHSIVGLTLAGVLAAPALAVAQGTPATPRGVAAISFGTQVATLEIDDAVTFTEFVEDGSFRSRYETGSGRLIDGGVAVALWHGLGVGVAVSAFESTDPAQVSLEVPHPFFFDRVRSFADTVDLTRRTIGVHVAAAYVLPTDRVRVALTGGPSFFSLSQEMVVDVAFQDSYPFDSLTDPHPTIQTESATGIGFHAGADVGVRLGSSVGVGVLLRYTRGTVDLMPTGSLIGSRPIAADVGGLHVAGGLRFYF